MKKTYRILSVFLLTMALTSCTSEKKAPEAEIKENQTSQNDNKEAENKSELATKEEKTEIENNSGDKTEKEDAKKEIEDLLKASSLLKSLRNQTKITIKNNDVEKTQVLEGEGEFDPKTGNILNGKYQITNSDGTYQKAEFVGDADKTMKLEEKDASGNITTNVENRVDYYVNPNYFDLVKIIDSMKDDLVLEDNGKSYKLTLDSKNIDLFGLFKEQFSLEFNNFTQNEAEKEFEIIIDKETNLLQNLKLSFKFDDDTKGHVFLRIESEFNDYEFDKI